jgi:MFS family permease
VRAARLKPEPGHIRVPNRRCGTEHAAPAATLRSSIVLFERLVLTSFSSGLQAGYPPRRHAWSVLLLLVLVAVVATLDRGVLSLVIDPIRHDLSISDVQISLLQGLSFSLFYATVGLALGFYTDRTQRCRLLAFGILLWSLSTIAAGFSTSFTSMFLSRLLVGMGEGTLGPCSISLIADLFPPARRGRPMGFFLMGQAIASGISILLTGAILRHLPHDLVLGTFSLHPWRVVFIVTGLPGLLVAPAILGLREPVRQERALLQTRLTLRQSLRLLDERRSVLMPLYLGFAAVSAGFYSTIAWGAVSITRHYGIKITQVTGLFGPASIVFGLAGPLLTGFLIDRIMSRGGASDRLRLLVVTPLLAIPAIACAVMPSAPLAILCVASMMGAYPASSTTFFSVLQGSVPNELRGFTISLCGLTNAVIGATGGPLLLALLSEHVYSGPAATAQALSTTLIVAMILGFSLFTYGRKKAVLV